MKGCHSCNGIGSFALQFNVRWYHLKFFRPGKTSPTRHVENEEIAKMSTWRVEFVGDSGSGVGRIMEKLKSLEISFQHTKPLV
mmetsp:Transcript_7368/g.15700  ORF Transcript_7368/g.15700 Transcript_7368/m.15700 type:complete len:83 (+) Transcript_7368:178-426(+)